MTHIFAYCGRFTNESSDTYDLYTTTLEFPNSGTSPEKLYLNVFFEIFPDNKPNVFSTITEK